MEVKMGGANRKANLSGQYKPMAVYYEDADMVEYVRLDVPCVNRRIDEFLTLALQMDGREPIGFKLKGFKNFYLHHCKDDARTDDRDRFLALVKVIEKATQVLGDGVFEEDQDRRTAYEQAYTIAKEDNAALRDLPSAA
jgi:hypothetical protein